MCKRSSRPIPFSEPLESRRLLTTWYVDGNSPGPTHDGSSWSAAYTDLQLALSAATSGDTIRVAQGTYKPTSSTDRTASFNLKSGVSLYGGYAGYASPAPDARDVAAHPAVLSGNIGNPGNIADNSYHVVVGSGTSATAVLDGFTVTAGYAFGIGVQSYGGGLYDASGSPTVRQCTFTGNIAGAAGGAIYNSSSSSPVIDGCTFTNNVVTTSNASGGAICNQGSYPTITDCTFAHNASSGSGGAVYYANCTSTPPILTNCTFTANTAATSGGAVYIYYYTSPRFTNCTFAGNTATTGGAVYDYQHCAPTLVNCVLVANRASDSGGAIYNDSNYTSPSLTNCTIVANAAFDFAGAIYSVPSNSNAYPAIANCIIRANTQADASPIYPATYMYPFPDHSDIEGGYPVGTAITDADPLFLRNPSPGPDGTWGTPDDDYGDLRLSSASPCVDAGSNATLAAGITTDRAGNARFLDVPTTPDTGSGATPVIDLGAYETAPALAASAGGPYAVLAGGSVNLTGRGASDLAGALLYQWDFNGDGQFDDATGPSPTLLAGTLPAPSVRTLSVRVTDSGGRTAVSTATVRIAPITVYVDPRATGGANGGTSWADAFTRLPDALALAVPGQTIRVAQGTYKPTSTTDRTVSFLLPSGTRVYGGYAGYGTANPDARDAINTPSALSGDIGIPGSAADNTYHVLVAHSANATTVLDGFTVTAGNAANPSAPQSMGGGVFVASGSPTIRNCTFTANAATTGGGALYTTNTAAAVLDCTFTNNTAPNGGAVYTHTIISAATPSIARCTFVGNTATTGGGAMYNAAAAQVSDCSFTGNTVNAHGGAVYNAASARFTNCTFAGNATTYGYGGAAFDSLAAVTFTDCTFTSNNSGGSGGAMYNSRGTATVTRCTFAANASADQGGGAVYNSGNSATFTDCAFYGNTSESSFYGGGAMYNSNGSGSAASVKIIDCVFSGNLSTTTGGALYGTSGSTTVTDSTFAGNTINGRSGAAITLNGSTASVVVANSILWTGTGATASPVYNANFGTADISDSDIQGGYSGSNNISADPRFYRNPSPGPDSTWGTPDDDYGDLRLLPSSPCLDAGSNAAVPAGTTTDLAGRPRITDFPGTGPADTAVVDMGAYESSTDLGDLHITPGQTVTLPAGGYAFTATQLIVDPGGTLDVADDSLLITYAGPSPLPAIRSALASGYHNGTWTGTGITSSAARSAPHHAVGYAEAASLGLTTFAGRPVDGPALLLKYTLAGDATLDGRLDADDFALADRGRARGTFDNWVHGDFDYDAAVTDADLALLTAAFAPPPPPAPVAATIAAPDDEPALVPVTTAILSAESPAPAPTTQQSVTPAIPPHHAKHKPKAKKAKHHLAKAEKPKHPHLVQSKHKKAKSPPHAAIHKHPSRAIHSSHPHSAR